MLEHRKIVKKLLFFGAILTLLLGCRTVSAAVKLNKTELNIYVGSTKQLKVSGGKATSWASYKKSVATISQNGVVTGRKKGTATVYAVVNGKKYRCTVNVKSKKLSKYVSDSYANIWLNIVGAVESGGQVYGERDYACFAGPYNSSPNEHSCTAGAYQEYGECLRELLIAIQTQYPSTFKQLDTANIAKDLTYSWNSTPFRAQEGSAKARCIQKIISSTQGREVQDKRAIETLDEYLDDIKSLGVTNLRAAYFMAECEHLGGFAAVKRVVTRATDKNSISALRKSLYKDQKDKSSSYQIGDTVYKSRHEAIYKWILKYIPASARI